MPPRGPKPRPTSLKLLAGTDRADRRNPHEPVPVRSTPACPDELDDAAREEWTRMEGLLEPLGLVSQLDRAALGAYCAAYSHWLAAEGALKSHGMLIKSPSGYPMVSPYFSIASKTMNEMRLLLQEFGLSPASRTRVTAMPPEPEEEHPIAALLREQREQDAGRSPAVATRVLQ